MSNYTLIKYSKVVLTDVRAVEAWSPVQATLSYYSADGKISSVVNSDDYWSAEYRLQSELRAGMIGKAYVAVSA